MLRDQNKAVLIDFGMASDGNKPKVGGTPISVAPEAKDSIRGPAGDIWALGVVFLVIMGYLEQPRVEGGKDLFQIANVRRKGSDRNAMDIWLAKIQDCVKELPVELDLLAMMLDESPETRITASDLQASLRKLAQESKKAAIQKLRAARLAQPTERRQKMFAGGAAR